MKGTRKGTSAVDQGYVQVYTGDGKGKTTAAIGLAVRAAGAGYRVYIGQFLKKGHYSEITALERFGDRIAVAQFGTGRFVVGQPDDAERQSAAKGLAALKAAMASGDYDVVIMEEANMAVAFGLIQEADLLAAIAEKSAGVELVITGRGATDAVMAAADLVTEMKAVKHYFAKGVAARPGIER